MKAIFLFPLLAITAVAGDFDPAAGEPGSRAIPLDDPRIRSWAETIHRYQPGEGLDALWQVPERALGPASGDPLDIVGLGRSGFIEFSWPHPLPNGPGPDLAVFENSFSDHFLELAYLEVSSDGESWQRFPSISQTAAPVGSFGRTDPTNLNGLAGKYRAGFGTGFDFSDLPDHEQVDQKAIRFVRLRDVAGDGSDLDSRGQPIYDPFPTFGSAGFDLDGLAVLAPPALTLLEASVSGGTVTFRWAVEPGTTYTLEKATRSSPPTWQSIRTLVAEKRHFSYSETTAGGALFRLRETPKNPG